MLRFESCIDMSIALMCKHDHKLRIKIRKRAGPIIMKVKKKAGPIIIKVKKRAGPIMMKVKKSGRLKHALYCS